MLSFLLYVGLVSVVLGCGENLGEVKWVDSSNNISPDGNFPYGSDSRGTYFICKGEWGGVVYGGSYLQSTDTKICRVINKDEEIKELTVFSVLVCAPSSIWSPALKKLIPNNAYAVGNDTICRGTSSNNPTIGTIGRILKFNEATSEWNEELVCRGIIYSKKTYVVGPLESFSVLTMTNTGVVTSNDEENETIDLFEPKARNIITFNAKATDELTMTFKDNKGKTVFEILLGGLYNSITAVRTRATGDQYTNSSYTPYILDELNYGGYFLYWDETHIAIGQAIKYPNVVPSKTPILSLECSDIKGVTKFSLKSRINAFWHIFK